MAPLDRFRRKDASTPTSTDDGFEPDVRKPRGAAGRGHTAGFLEYEEHNRDLQHPHGQQVYDKMYRNDGDVRQVVQLSTNPIVGGTWSVVPYGDQEASDEAIEQAKFARWALWEQMRPNLLGHLIEFLPVLVRAGFVPGEVIWKYVDYEGSPRLVPRTIALRLPRTIWQWEQDEFGELTRLKQYLPSAQRDLTMVEGGKPVSHNGLTEIWLPRKELVYYRLGGEGDNWEGVSLLRPAYKHWLMKDRIERIDAIAQEREALGVPICYPPSGATSDQLDEVETILANMRTNEEGYIVAPGPKAGSGLSNEGTGWLFEVIGYDRTGSGRDPMPSLNYHTQKIAAAFISEFMRLGHGTSGARATAQVQADPFLMSIEALATVVEQQLNDDIMAPLMKANYPGITEFPRLQMSLVDSTSLAQLADFVQKLTQIGALMPDQELEDFLRARADLPAANPESVKNRKEQDDELRRMIVTGGVTDPKVANEAAKAPAGDPFGSNDKPGKPHGTKSAPGSDPGSTGGTNRGKKDGTRSRDDDSVVLSDYDPSSDRYRPRSRRHDELWVDLDGIEDWMDDAPTTMERACKSHLLTGDEDAIGAAAEEVLANAYTKGHSDVLMEAAAQNPTASYDAVGMQLSTGARASGGMLRERARAIAKRVVAEMEDHRAGHSFAHGNSARSQIAAERAGASALRRAGHDHGVAAYLHGRHDGGTYLASNDSPFSLMGVRYSAILDKSTCEECRHADDGQVRDLVDPVRLHRMPPNPDCLSTHSGHNRCRCFETYEVMPSQTSLSLDDIADPTGDAPVVSDFIAGVARRLIESGMPDASRAVQVATQITRDYCRTGKVSWPGLRDIGTRVDACAAV